MNGLDAYITGHWGEDSVNVELERAYESVEEDDCRACDYHADGPRGVIECMYGKALDSPEHLWEPWCDPPDGCPAALERYEDTTADEPDWAGEGES